MENAEVYSYPTIDDRVGAKTKWVRKVFAVGSGTPITRYVIVEFERTSVALDGNNHRYLPACGRYGCGGGR